MDCKNISMSSVLDKLGIQYKKIQGDEYHVYDGSELADGRTFNEGAGLMHNFTPGKDRPSGSVIDLVMWSKRFETKEAIQRLEKEFNLEQQKKPTIWDGLVSVPPQGIEYLESRGIDYTKVKSFVKRQDGLALAVYKNNQRAGIAIRTLSSDKKQRFRSVKGTDGKAVYMHNLDTSQDHIYVVEGFFDFLTLRQFIPNVIGLRSACDGLEIVKEYAKTHQLILCPHNDDAGSNLTKQLEENGCFVFDVGSVSPTCNDLNDIRQEMLAGGEDDILLLIDGLKQKKEPVDNKIRDLGYIYPDGVVSDKFGCLRSGELCMVAAASNKGKTSFVLSILKSNHEIGKKVAMINMEFDLEEGFRYEYFRARGHDDSELKAIGTDLKPITPEEMQSMTAYIEKRKNEVKTITKDQDSTLEEIIDQINILKDQGYTLVAIDSLSSIQGCDSDLKMQNKAMKEFRNYCTRTGMTIILIHHFNKGGETYSGSGKIKDLCNVVIEMHSTFDDRGRYYRVFILEKDKTTSERVFIHTYYEDGQYIEVPQSIRNTDKKLNSSKDL